MDADGLAGAGQASVSFAAYAGDVRTLEIAQTATVSAGGRVIGLLGQVVERNFYGNGEDEILAVDKIIWTGTTPTTSTFWTFADHQGTIRDIVSGNTADRGKVVEHRQYDSFGKVLARTANLSPGAATLPGSGVGVAFGYTGRPIAEKTGLSDYRVRWYDASTGRFVTADPGRICGRRHESLPGRFLLRPGEVADEGVAGALQWRTRRRVMICERIIVPSQAG